jgi:hypothetical protein
VNVTRARTVVSRRRAKPALAAEPLARPLDRILTAGRAAALAGVAIQTLVHLLNAALDGRPQLDANAEHNVMTWGSSVATFAAAFAAALHAILLPGQRRGYILLACLLAFFSLDEAILLHERLSGWILDSFGFSASWDSVLWPALYLPLAAPVVLILVAVARTAPVRASRFILVGLILLVSAVAAEALSAPLSTPETAGGWAHVLEGAYEEGAELVGWILIGAGLTVSTLFEVAREAPYGRSGAQHT